MRAPLKNPKSVAAGQKAARVRWGPPRIARLDGLTPEQRRLVLAMIEMARASDSKADRVSETSRSADAEVRRGSVERSAA